MKISLKETLSKLPLPATAKWPEGVWDFTAFERGDVSLLLFAPKGRDYQTPHSQDELYIVVRGRGAFIVEGEATEFEPGDALFVAARKAHHFERISDDLLMWVVFWGAHHGPPEGAKQDKASHSS